MTEPEQGPYRDDGRPSTPPARWSIPALVSLPTVILGWIGLFGAASSGTGAPGLAMGLIVLLGGVTFAGLGLAATQPRPITEEDEESPGLDDDVRPPVPRGRPLAKLALGAFLTPIVLGCIGLGLLFLACGGH